METTSRAMGTNMNKAVNSLQKRDNVRNKMKAQFIEQEEITIPTLKFFNTRKKIIFKEYDGEMDKLRKTITDQQDKMKEIDMVLSQQDEYIQNMSIKVSLQKQENKVNFESMKKDSKLNIKETLNTRRIANNNQQ